MHLIAASTLALAFIAVPADAQAQLSSVDRAAAFRAAGFKQVSGQWRACDAPRGSVYEPGKIEEIRDLNGDGRPEAIITEGSSFCYGGDEVGFVIVSKQANSTWKLIVGSEGIANVLKEKGTRGWPDIEIAGQGFCFPVQRWNGKEYRTVRFQYQGKACRRPR
ncbi:hypothetical protein M9978_18825 [Sphingomonas sp. MG17]|uniref:FG-GAP repeat-containing protein n=1 Tax=Sphingomonas tagetis TaxID=2949092 RepID=A0A9X2HJQ7_9SPHN|nr:hypothetical protein [Sphingomonas tagetis]MCP3732481.1 hypothetical protein [Sphingomonas tagetis]